MRQLRRSTNRFFSDIIRALTGQDPRRGFSLAIFTVTTIFVIDNLVNVYQIWAAESTVDGGQLLRHVGVPLLVAALVWIFVQRSERMVGMIDGDDLVTPHKGLIWLITPNPHAIEIAVGAIGHHQPVLTDVWVIGTFHYPGMTESYEALQREVGERDWDVTWHKEPIDEPTLRQAYDAVKRIHHAKPGNFVDNDIVADITGGFKTLSTGMFIACVENTWPMSYVDTPRDNEGKPAGPPRPVALDIQFIQDVRLEDEPTE